MVAHCVARRVGGGLIVLVVLAAGGTSVAPAAENAFDETVLIANRPELHPTVMVDPHMIDAWGIALRPPGAGGHIWISNAGDGTTTEYIGDVNGIPLHQDGLKIVPIENPAFTDHGFSQVTGQVYNAASDVPGQPIEFPISGDANNWATDPPAPLGTTSGAAKFVFVTRDGTINAWRSNTAAGMTSAVIAKDYSITSVTPLDLPVAPVYTGVAMTTDAFILDGQGHGVASNRLYVTDFENGRIQVFDNQWNDITDAVPFQRPADIPADWNPFNIQLLGGRLYVTYAQVLAQGEEPGDEVDGPGLGHIVAYDRDGHLLQEFADTGALNAPWGLAIAPAGFGPFGDDLLVANFGDGTIAAFDRFTGLLDGFLHDAHGNNISIEGIWGLTFGNGVSLGDANALYFTAGPGSEFDGVFGRLNVVPEPSTAALALCSLLFLLAAVLFRRGCRYGHRSQFEITHPVRPRPRQRPVGTARRVRVRRQASFS